ncbi:hypothetical protein NE237_001744 [Protea cynaroides]|uniref:Uncharacterized protein n=1 Tax=Protea cynaroides TaxID=273540 RepID=A0A9Q0KTP2_9MAGN|nr:hypothetical protein NE237_001744 [Protea cynaroides]
MSDLIRRGWLIQDEFQLCDPEEEGTYHLLLGCWFGVEVLSGFFLKILAYWIFPCALQAVMVEWGSGPFGWQTGLALENNPICHMLVLRGKEECLYFSSHGGEFCCGL